QTPLRPPCFAAGSEALRAGITIASGTECTEPEMPWVDAVDAPSPEPSNREKAQVEDYLRRRKKPRFYCDENYPAQATGILRRWGFNVVTAQEANLRGHPDENQLAEARREGRILLSCDRDYLNERRFPLTDCSTVAVFSFGDGSLSEM